MKRIVSIALDDTTIELLSIMAQEYEDNKSLTLRYLIREAARARGLVIKSNRKIELESNNE